MKIGYETAISLWKTKYGNQQYVADFSGRYMFIEDYNKKNTPRQSRDGKYYTYGWNIHHIMPISLGGTDDESNLAIVHWLTNEEAANKITFTANNRLFQVKKIKYESIYGIFDLRENIRVE